MKTSNVNLNELLDQLSDSRINLVVDSDGIRGGGGECGGSGSGSSKSNSSKSSKSSKSGSGKCCRFWC